MLLHYQILSRGQYLIPEVLDFNERCFAPGHWGAKSTSLGILLAFVKEYQRTTLRSETRRVNEAQGVKHNCMQFGTHLKKMFICHPLIHLMAKQTYMVLV